MPFIGQAVPHRHIGVLRKIFHNILTEAAVFDAIEKAAEHTGSVGHGFLLAYLGPGRSEVGHMSALVVGGTFEGAAGSCGVLLKYQGDVAAFEQLGFPAFLLGLLEFRREVQQIAELFRRKVGFLQEVSLVQSVHMFPFLHKTL